MPTKTAHYRHRLFARYDRQLKDAADVVLYSGRKLFREATEPNRFFLEQAVDFEHFSNLKVEPAPELDGIPHPILGYFGSMDYVMDTELMAEVARLRPEWHWVLLGLKSNLVRIAAPNIHFLGSKPYRQLAALHSRNSTCVFCPGGRATLSPATEARSRYANIWLRESRW